MNKPREYWYILSCIKGGEDQVKNSIWSAFENSNIKERLKDIKIVWRKVKTSSGKINMKNVYPGYIYISLDLDEDSWFIVRNVPGVYSFIGSTGNRTKPIPLTQDEVAKMKEELNYFYNKEAYFNINLEPGNTVIVKKHNIFKNQKGIVSAVNLITGEIIVNVTFMNKKHKLNLNYEDVKKG